MADGSSARQTLAGDVPRAAAVVLTWRRAGSNRCGARSREYANCRAGVRGHVPRVPRAAARRPGRSLHEERRLRTGPVEKVQDERRMFRCGLSSKSNRRPYRRHGPAAARVPEAAPATRRNAAHPGSSCAHAPDARHDIASLCPTRDGMSSTRRRRDTVAHERAKPSCAGSPPPRRSTRAGDDQDPSASMELRTW